MRKYVLRHPDITKYFNENNSVFHGNTWSPYRQNYIGYGLRHDDKLTDKRWELNTRLVNEVCII